MPEAPPLPTVEKINLGGQLVDVQFFLAKEYDDVAEAAAELPQLIEWVNEQHQQCLEGKLVAEAELDERRAHAYFELKGSDEDTNFSGSYPGKMTEDALNHAVAIDKRVVEIGRELATWVSWSSRLSNLMRSLTAKLELTRSSEATRRQVFDKS